MIAPHSTLANAANFVLFQLVWFACVMGAAAGRPWLGPLAVAAWLALHAFWPGRPRELKLVLAVTLIGTAVDSALRAVGLLGYSAVPGGWPTFVAPPWIIALWAAFAALLRHSLAWLTPRPWLGAAFGAIGGPLSFLAGRRLGAVELHAERPALSLVALALEWAILTPALGLLARRGSNPPTLSK